MITHSQQTYSGPWSECSKRFPAAELPIHERRWHRAQMRSWALAWRKRKLHAAMVGTSVAAYGRMMVELAIVYRNAERRLA